MLRLAKAQSECNALHALEQIFSFVSMMAAANHTRREVVANSNGTMPSNSFKRGRSNFIMAT
jgi:hypothetical protein